MKKRKLNSKNPKYWDKSLLNEKPIAKKVLYKNTKGIAVIIEALLLMNNMYKIINKAERIKKVFLKTLIIESECLIKL